MNPLDPFSFPFFFFWKSRKRGALLSNDQTKKYFASLAKLENLNKKRDVISQTRSGGSNFHNVSQRLSL